MNAKKRRPCFGVLISIFVIPLMFFAAIWGCVTAPSKIEKLIRSDEELSRLDKTLNNSYLQALNRTDIKEKTIESQSQWLKNERNVCQDTECIKRAYNNRIKELGFTSSYGIVFFRDQNSNTSPQGQIHSGPPVQTAEPAYANNNKVPKAKYRENKQEKNYSNWIGVKAPDIGTKAVDREDGPQIRLDNYKGKYVLLYGFDTGNFVFLPSEKERKATDELLYKALSIRDSIGRHNFEIIGFTQGFGMDWRPPYNSEIPIDFQKYLESLKDMPLAFGSPNFPEPYNILCSPSGIIIDRNGIIREIIPRAMTEEEIKRVAEASRN